MDNQQTFRVTGMDCASCAKTVENGIAKLNGVDSCQLNFTTETLRVSGTALSQNIINRIQELGYDVAAPDEKIEATEPLTFWQFMRQRQETTEEQNQASCPNHDCAIVHSAGTTLYT